MKLLKFSIPSKFSTSFFENEIAKLTNGKGNYRIRYTVFRSGQGFYQPKSNDPWFVIKCTPLDENGFVLNVKGKQMGLFDDIKLSHSPISKLKTCNSIPYILASIYARTHGYDDCFLIDNKGNIAEATSSNIFILKNENLLTPSLSSACVAGVMRDIILDIADSDNIEVKQCNISKDKLKEADEIWLTNSIKGIQWVDTFEGKFYDNKIAKQFVQSLNQILITD